MGHLPRRPDFIELTEANVITEIAVHLVGFKDGRFDPAGTATVIAPNLCITAKHVIEHFCKAFDGEEPPKYGQFAATFNMHATQVLANEQTSAVYNIQAINLVPWSDLAVIPLLPANDSAQRHPWNVPILSLLPPEIESFIAGFGYHASKVDIDHQDKSVRVHRSQSTTVGQVLEVHDVERDKSRLNFPCFRTNARFDGGMSGGPVFDDDGHLCGIICSSIPPYLDNEDHISYVASLWPMVGLKLDLPIFGMPDGSSYPMMELFRKGAISAVDLDLIELLAHPQGDPNGGAIRFRRRKQ